MAKWVVYAKRADFRKLGEQFHIDPVIARIIRNRDIVGEDAVRRFLYGTPDELHPPRLLKDMDRAVAILREKIAGHAKIRIIGDYDVDGICASYILLSGIRYCGGTADVAIPHRVHDGYGINVHMVEEAYADGVDTIVTCDNGIAAGEQIGRAAELGMTVVVTDHHEVPYETAADGARTECLPPADAVVNPKQAQCPYPFDGICGAVVAYKLVQALLDGDTDPAGAALLEELLGFAAFATVGDVMELVDENRIIVRYGLRQIAQTRNLGLQALLTVNGLRDRPLSAYHLGFVLGPCVNATGRLDTAFRALQLFLSRDAAEAAVIAGELKELNDSRKNMTLQGAKRAIDMIERQGRQNDSVLVVYLEDCHESLAGIIAGRIKERYHRPVFVLTDSEDGVKGSGRSIEAYPMYDRMSECRELYTRYGGHRMAAGVSMPRENVERFREYLNAHCGLTPEDFEEKIRIDAAMPMSYVTPELVRQLGVLEPFGNGNPRPVFAQKNLRLIRGRILGKNNNVGKYETEDSEGRRYEMMYFGDLEKWQAFLTEQYGQAACDRLYGPGGGGEIRIHAVYYPELDVYQGRERLQMILQDYCKGDDIT